MQPVCTAVLTPCHAGRGLAGHPRCVNVDNDYGKTRLYIHIFSKTTALTWCARFHSAQRVRSSPPHRGDESAGKRSHRNRSSSPERVRLLQPLLPRPQKRRQPVTYSRSQTPELRHDEKVVQDDHFETDPPANMPRGLVHVAGSERRVLSHPGSPLSQTILEIRIRRGGISIQGPAVWAIPGSPHFYTMHGYGSLPSATDGNPHTQLPRRLAHSGPVADGFIIAQDPPQPLRLPGAKGQLCQEHTVTQPMSFVPGYSYRLQMTATVITKRAMTIQRHAASFKEDSARPLKAFQRMLELMAAASPVLQLGLLHMRPIQFWLKQRVPFAAWHHGRHHVTVTRACVSALVRWRDPFFKMNQGADMLSRNYVSSEEWMLHPLAVQRIWEIFGRAQVDLFASKDSSHCPIFLTRSTDALAHEWPSLPLYAFPQALCYCRYSGESENNGTSWF